MAELVFNSNTLARLRQQCLHHNVFPIYLEQHLEKPPAVASLLNLILDDCHYQLAEMNAEEIAQLVNSLPIGYREFLEPIPDPLPPAYIERVAFGCVRAEIQKGYSPVSHVIDPKPRTSAVLDKCPELEKLIDDDGMIHLTKDFTLLDGGIRYGKYLLHYHQFLRRGFCSNPNFDFLAALSKYHRRTNDHNHFRIAIDHRRIMLFEDWVQNVEFDHWYGPRFERDSLDDPNCKGLTVIERTLPTSLDSYAILKTEFLWKTNEAEGVRTLEIEELSCPEKPREGWNINRYLHAERDTTRSTFRHFDGAAKVYANNAYLDRIHQSMPNNPRPNHYIKLFRIDGETNLEDWLFLISMFYKDNEMLTEYFDPGQFNDKVLPMRLQKHERWTRTRKP